MRTEVNITTENAAETFDLFAALASMNPAYRAHLAARVFSLGESDMARAFAPMSESTPSAPTDAMNGLVKGYGANVENAISNTDTPVVVISEESADQAAVVQPAPTVVQEPAPEPVKRTRKSSKTATPELAPTTGPSPSNPGPSIDLDAALDAAGATTLEGDVLSPGEEQAPQEDAAGEPEGVALEAAAEEEPASDIDDLMGDMLDAPTKSETQVKSEPKQEAKAEPAVDDSGDPRTESQLHQAVRDEVINRGGGWLRDMLGSMHINRISDLTKAQALSLLASPVTA